MYVPIRKNSVDFSLTAGLGTAKLITGYAGVDGTDSVDKFYTNSDVKFTRYGAGLDFYLSPPSFYQQDWCNQNMMILVLQLIQLAPRM